VGAGGLGSPALLYLAAAGVGRIGSSTGHRGPVEPAAAGDPHRCAAGHAQGLLRPGRDRGAEPACGGAALQPCADRGDRRGAVRRVRPDPRRHGQLRDPRAGQPRGGGRGPPGAGRGDQRVGGAGDALRSGLGRALHGLRLSHCARAGAGRDLCRDRGDRRLAGGRRLDDGAGGGEADHRRGRGAGGADADL
jgi:hypothetical protein